MNHRSLFALVAFASLTACASTSEANPAPAHTFVFLRASDAHPAYTDEQVAEFQKGHMANISRLFQEHRLLVAGPFGKPRPDPALRGLFVLAGGDASAAAELVATDPAVHAGVLAPEIVTFDTPTDLAAVHERDLAFEQRRAADPSIPMGAGMRTYFALFAENAEQASNALAPLREQRWIVLEGRFGAPREGQGVFVVSAPDAESAHAALAPLANALGPHQAFGWWGSASLATE